MFLLYCIYLLFLPKLFDMLIYKFGGSSLGNAEGIRNITDIVKKAPENLVVVVSALGKTTNALERLVGHHLDGNITKVGKELETIRQFHQTIVTGLFGSTDNETGKELNRSFRDLEEFIKKPPSSGYDQTYDQIVSRGELWSTRIIASWLIKNEIPVRWMDIREYLKTDDIFRDAHVDWHLSGSLIHKEFNNPGSERLITQGFIGGTTGGLSTTLGREGSDYTAAILAHVLDAEKVVIWKDVPGVMSADPATFPDAVKLDELSYHEALEIAYYGAKVIHPKTIKPLHNKNIPLFVKSFNLPDEPGTIIHLVDHPLDLVPVYVIKPDQILVSVAPKDYSFIVEENLGKIFSLFNIYRIPVNLIQNSAVSITVCVNQINGQVYKVIDELKKDFEVRFNEDVELVTIRYYNQEAINKMTRGRKVLLEQMSRLTAQLVLK